MPRTPAQRTASQLNGSKSKGPTTDQGRRKSSRNATKHGLSGSGKSLPPDMQTELLSEISLFSTQFHPHTPYEHDLIRRAALGNLRARRIADTLNTLCDDRARNAIRLWDETRSSEISSLASQLPHDPQSAVRQLRQTTEGCDYLADALDTLSQTLQTHGFLDESQSLHLLNLLGHPEPPSLKDATNPLSPLWLSLLSLQFDHNPRPLMRTIFRHVSPTKTPLHHTKSPLHHTENPLHHTENPPQPPEESPLDHVRHLLPDPSEARADLAQFLQSQIADLEKQGNLNWQTYDLPSRQSAPLRAAFDASPETVLLNRYLASAERLRRQSLDELHRLRKTSGATGSASAQPNEPNPPTPHSSASSAPLRETPPPQQNEPDPTPSSTTPSHQPAHRTPRNIPQSLLSPLEELFAPTNQTSSFIPFNIGRSS